MFLYNALSCFPTRFAFKANSMKAPEMTNEQLAAHLEMCAESGGAPYTDRLIEVAARLRAATSVFEADREMKARGEQIAKLKRGIAEAHIILEKTACEI